MKRSRTRGEEQLTLFDTTLLRHRPPSTRYQGSKLKLLDWIWENIVGLSFDTALEAFGGTGCVSYLMKSEGKQITYNDNLKFNSIIGKAIIENQSVRLSQRDTASLFEKRRDVTYDDFIARTFSEIYFTDEENEWLDIVCQNIPLMEGEYQQALAYYALFQSCIIKRPYNLFHRKNLYMRTSEVPRSFGNKATWDTAFETHFRAFIDEANDCVLESEKPCYAVCHDALEIPGKFDLVYIDTPYLNSRGTGVDYLDFYHFLEGLVDYAKWSGRVDYKRKHHPLKRNRSPWSDPKQTYKAFEKLFERYADSLLVVSYRSDGIPSEEQLSSLLRRFKKRVDAVHYGEYKYVLSTNGKSKELLLIGQ